jgi:two-component system, OmpR family, response regulator RpaA
MAEPFTKKAVFTTGEVAQICSISQQTVIRCFDSGRLRGFRVPGSKFRRIPRGHLIHFMRENNIPTDKLERQSKRVVVIDDDKAVVDMLVDLLQRDGFYEVKTGHTGFEAGLLARDFLPDVLLLDLKLPDVNGNIVCQRIRATPEMSHTKIIMISGVADPDEIDQLMKAGADAFIKKPFDVDQVLKRIDMLTSA